MTQKKTKVTNKKLTQLIDQKSTTIADNITKEVINLLNENREKLMMEYINKNNDIGQHIMTSAAQKTAQCVSINLFMCMCGHLENKDELFDLFVRDLMACYSTIKNSSPSKIIN